MAKDGLRWVRGMLLEYHIVYMAGPQVLVRGVNLGANAVTRWSGYQGSGGQNGKFLLNGVQSFSLGWDESSGAEYWNGSTTMWMYLEHWTTLKMVKMLNFTSYILNILCHVNEKNLDLETLTRGGKKKDQREWNWTMEGRLPAGKVESFHSEDSGEEALMDSN